MAVGKHNPISWLLGIILLLIGILNIFQVHPVPGITYIILSLLYFPFANSFLKNKLNFSIPLLFKITLFLLIMWFTLGISDLAEIYGL